MTPVDFLIVEERIKEELENLNRLHQTLQRRGLLEDSHQRRFKLMDEWVARAVGSILHDMYSAMEKMFRIIARDLDGKLPDGAEWHNELLIQMSIPLAGIRPAVISKELRTLLSEFLAFRHVFRNVYGFNLAPERLDLLLKKVPDLCKQFKDEMVNFLHTMHECMDQ